MILRAHINDIFSWIKVIFIKCQVLHFISNPYSIQSLINEFPFCKYFNIFILIIGFIKMKAEKDLRRTWIIRDPDVALFRFWSWEFNYFAVVIPIRYQ